MTRGKTKYRILLGFFIMLSLALLSSCTSEGEKGEPSYSLIINGSIIEEASASILIDNTYFIRLDFIERYIDINPKLKQNSHITQFVNLNEWEMEEELKAFFYNPKAVIVSLPLIQREGFSYIDVNYLTDFYGFTRLEFSSGLVLFSPDYEALPNRVGLLGRGTKVELEAGAQSRSMEEDEEVYFFDADGAEKVLFYSPSLGPALSDRRLFQYVSDFKLQRRKLEARQMKARYGKYLMAFDDISSYEQCIEAGPAKKFEGLSLLLPRTLGLKEGKLLSRQDLAYMDEALKLGFDVLAVLDLNADEELIRLLKDDFSVRSTIDSLLFYALYYGYTGVDINASFLKEGDRSLVSAFLSKMSTKFKAAGLNFALNLYPADKNSYDLAMQPPLNTAVDYYLALFMDEDSDNLSPHPSQSRPWVEEKLSELLKKLPSEKIVLAQGLYARVYEYNANGTQKLENRVVPISELEERTSGLIIESKKDEERDQIYYKYKNPDTRGYYVFWMDDEESYARKFQLVNSKKLAGLALWTYRMLDEDVMLIIKKALEMK